MAAKGLSSPGDKNTGINLSIMEISSLTCAKAGWSVHVMVAEPQTKLFKCLERKLQVITIG
jgi:pentose-5-phosphate-3-epimerase